MTRDEVMALTDEELNAAVFAILYPECPQPVTVPAGQCLEVVTRIRIMRDWVHDIAAAWELWGLLVVKGHTMELFSRTAFDCAAVVGWPRPDGSYAYDEVGGEPLDEDDDCGLFGGRAITRAFVLAMQGGPDIKH
jgi:hypothetical protein